MKINQRCEKMNDYLLQETDELILTGKQIKEFKKAVIKEYQNSEYQAKVRTKAIREGFLEGIQTIEQWIINEQNLDPQPCCHGVRIEDIRKQITKLKEKGDKRFVLDQKHLDLIKQRLEQGQSKNDIAKELNVSIATVVYWTNPRYRKRQMEKNAKRRYNKKLIPVDESPRINEERSNND